MSDVYSIGAVLYHLLSGEVPYVMAGSRVGVHTVLAMVLQGPPRPLHEVRGDVPAELQAICERAMERDPKQRYGRVSELAEDLAAFLEGRVVHAYETGTWAEARKWMRRNEALAASLAAAALLLVVGLATALYLRAESQANFELAEERREEAESNSRLAEERRVEAQANEERALASKAEATRRAEEVLRLSALQDYEDLVTQADELWPPHPVNIEAYEEWIEATQSLVALLTCIGPSGRSCARSRYRAKSPTRARPSLGSGSSQTRRRAVRRAGGIRTSTN